MEVARSEVSVKSSKTERKISWIAIISFVLGVLSLLVDVGNFGFVQGFFWLAGVSGEIILPYMAIVPTSLALSSMLIGLAAVLHTSTRNYLSRWYGWAWVGFIISMLALVVAIFSVFALYLNLAL